MDIHFRVRLTCRDLLYLDLALEGVVRGAAERGAGAAGGGAGALVGPLLQNLVLSVGDNEELCYCLKAWQALPAGVTAGAFPGREDALKARQRQMLPEAGDVGRQPAVLCSRRICLHALPSARQRRTRYASSCCLQRMHWRLDLHMLAWPNCVSMHARVS